jgi:hypothetical protein
MCLPWSVAGGTRSRLVKEIGLITQAARRSVIRTIRYSIARFRFPIRPCVLVSCLLRPLPLACAAVYCRRPRPRKPGSGGAEEARTPDPLLAKEVLSQLSYGPALGLLVIGGWMFEALLPASNSP